MRERIFNVIASVFEVDIKKVSVDMKFSDFNTYESIRFINLITAIEEEFDISFDFEQIKDIVKVQQFEDLIIKTIG